MKILDRIKMQFADVSGSASKITNSAIIQEYANQYSGANRYRTSERQVKELASKYDGAASFGCLIAQALVDTRAAVTIGSGIRVVQDPLFEGDATREIDFCNSLMEDNNLDEETIQDFAREAEIEGRILLKLVPKNESVYFQWIPWTQFQYTVIANPNDFTRYDRVKYQINGEEKQISDSKQFVYKKFGGRAHKVNDCRPVLGAALGRMEDFDRALYDWRLINRAFGSPTPWFDCASPNAAQDLDNKLDTMNWKLGKVLITSGVKFSIVTPSLQGAQSIQEELVTIIKQLSSIAGIPVHFLGYPDLLSNRATADNLLEQINISTNKPRRLWIGAYEEAFRKAIVLASEKIAGYGDLNPEAITIEIPETTESKLQEISTIWIPLFTAGGISKELLLSQLPEIDLEAEMNRQAKEEEERVMKMELSAARFQDDEEENGAPPIK